MNEIEFIEKYIESFVFGKKSFSACINALKDVDNVELGTYLPSNPEAIIIGLLAESGVPMQR